MSIQISGGVYRNDVLTATGGTAQAAMQDLLVKLNATLVAAGWTSTVESACNMLVVTGQPSDGDTITLDGIVYRFKNTMAAAEDVKIGADATASYGNLIAAINGSGTVGVEYYTGTTAPNPNIEASGSFSGDTGKMLVHWRTGGIAGNDQPIAETLANAAFSYAPGGTATLIAGGYIWKSAVTPAVHQMQVRGMYLPVVDGSLAGIGFALASPGGDIVSDGFVSFSTLFPYAALTSAADYGILKIQGGPASVWRVVASKYQFFMWDVAAGRTDKFKAIFASVPWIPSGWAAKTITNATHTTPITITAPAHGFSNGETVLIRGVEGNWGANGTWVITYVDPSTFSLDGSAAYSDYTNGGVVGRVGKEIVEVGILACAGMADTGEPFIRGVLSSENTPYQAFLNNAITVKSDGFASQGTSLCLGIICPGNALSHLKDIRWYGGDYVLGDAPLFMYSEADGDLRLVGQLWNTAIMHRTEGLGVVGTFLAQNWYVVSMGLNTEYNAAVAMIVP